MMRDPKITLAMLREPSAVAYVYGIRCEPYIKIGSARDIKQRLEQLSIGNPFPLRVATFEAVSAHYVFAIEKRVHQLLAEWHHRGEWYQVETRQAGRAIRQAMVDIAEIVGADEAYAERMERKYPMSGAQESRGRDVESGRHQARSQGKSTG